MLLPIVAVSILAVLAEVQAECVISDFSKLPEALDSCTEIVLDNLNVPGGEPLSLILKDGIKLSFRGNTTFGYAEWEGPLVAINGTNVNIEGEEGAILDGQGAQYWDGLGEWGAKLKPKFFVIQLHNSTMTGINVLNPPIHTVLLTDSSDVILSDWDIDASAGDEDLVGVNAAGHNTDGFDIWNGTNIILRKSSVHNQDDCIAIRCGSNILVEEMRCHGGHGLSVSVGFSNFSIAENTLTNVTIRRSNYTGDNAIHVKTHVDGGKGLIQNVTYEDITFTGPTYYGIRIQQNYRNSPPHAEPVLEPKDNIPIRGLTLRNIVGTVFPSAEPINIVCADDGCSDWNFQNISVSGGKTSECNYVPSGFNC